MAYFLPIFILFSKNKSIDFHLFWFIIWRKENFMPRPRSSFEDFKFLYEGTKYEVDTSKHFTVNTTITITCDKGHKFLSSVTKVKSLGKDPKICPHCINESKNNEVRISFTDISDFFKETNWEVVYENDFYSKWEGRITLKCKNDGNIQYIKSIKYWNDNRTIPLCDRCKEINTEKKLGVFLEKLEEKVNITHEKIELKPEYTGIDTLPPQLKERYLAQTQWRLVEYINTRTFAIFQCVKCGFIKKALPYNCLLAVRDRCENCMRIEMRDNVYNKMYEQCKESLILPIENSPYVAPREYIKFKCEKCNHEFEQKWYNINSECGRNKLSCPNCFKNIKRKEETEFADYIRELVGSEKVTQDTKKIIAPYELDVYIEELKLAFEYCGNIWHSGLYRDDPDVHKKKHELCETNGIRLITLFADEWKDSRNICESRIKNLLGLLTNKIPARKCEVKEVDTSVALSFCEENHLQGKGQCREAYGLYFEGTLVSIMTFSVPSISKSGSTRNYDWELNRFCSKLDTLVIGGANRLIEAFKEKHKGQTVVTFCDLRWGNGKVYENMGFTFDYKTDPNYYYVGAITNWKRKHRFNFTRERLREIFKVTDETKTERMIAEENELFRIYDCGHNRYSLKIT